MSWWSSTQRPSRRWPSSATASLSTSTNPARATGSSHCSPILPNHLELAINDWFKPAADFLGSALVDRNPPHVTYVVDPARDSRKYGVVANHAYWVSGLKVRT